MGLTIEWVRYGERRAYLARPARAQTPLPGILVLQEIWGVDPHIQDVTRRFARAGYVALAPDLWARDAGERPAALAEERVAELKAIVDVVGPAVWMDPAKLDQALAGHDAAPRARILETMAALRRDFGPAGLKLDVHLAALTDAAGFLRAHEAVRGRQLGSVGFCMGGGLSSLLACHDPALGAAVSFYGSPPSEEDCARIVCPVLAFHGSLDQRLIGGVPGFADAMKRRGKSLELQVYQGAQHAFFNDDRPAYHPDAARDAFARTLGFFNRLLS